MNKLIQKTHVFILLWVAYTSYSFYETHIEKLEEIKNRVPVMRNKIKRKRKELKELQNYLKDIEEAKKQIEKVAQENERIQKKFPTSINDSENLSLVSSLANKLNILNLKLTPKEEKKKGFYFSKVYNLTGTGTFLQFLILLEKISDRKDKLMNIGQIELKRSNVRNKGRFQLIDANINLIVYRYNSSFKEDRGIDKIETGLKKKKKIKRKS